MGAVYQAADTRFTNKIWAVKEMSSAAITNPLERQESLEAFRREAETLSALAHPNIPRVIDFFSEQGNQYLVMEFVAGKPLDDVIIHNGGPLPEDRVRDWTKQLANVLDYLHTQHPPIIFKDLKPGNIMLADDDSLKLIDFGIIRFFQPGKSRDTVAFGTDGYAPPEQYGKGQTDARSDIYALGATLHHLLTNHDPASTPFRFEPVRKYNPRISPAMENVIMRAIEQNPAQRWQTAREMQQAIGGEVKSLVASPSTPSSGIRLPVSSPAPVVKPQHYHPTPIKTYTPVPAGLQFAGFGRRFTAFMIDSFITGYIPQFIITLISASVMQVGQDQPDLESIAALFNCILLSGWLLFVGMYFVVIPAHSGQTLGKKMLGIKIVNTSGDAPGEGRCLLRWIGYMVSSLILYIGFLMPLWTERKQALHDMMASTYVVRV